MRKIPYPHPGEILMHEFLEPMGISQYRLAKEIGVPQRRIGKVVAGTRAVTVDTGLRLSRFFGTCEGFWTGLQLDYDSPTPKDALAKELAQIKPWAGHHRPSRVEGAVSMTTKPPPKSRILEAVYETGKRSEAS